MAQPTAEKIVSDGTEKEANLPSWKQATEGSLC